MSESAPATNEDVVATAGQYYRRMRYFVAVLLLAGGLWFARDGWYGWPEMNHKYVDVSNQIDTLTRRIEETGNPADKKQKENLIEQRKDLKFHDDLSILLQKILAFVLPALGVALVSWAIYNSRGEIRLTQTLLTAPGHPPLTMDQITALDKRLWDRKDIAFIEYEAGAATGRIRLDAFVYQTDPIVKIFDRIEALMQEDGA